MILFKMKSNTRNSSLRAFYFTDIKYQCPIVFENERN